MDIWDYDRFTGALLGKSVADPDPEFDGNWLIPAFATTVRPPFVPPGCVAVFNGGPSGQGSWRIELKSNERDICARSVSQIAYLATVIDECRRRTGSDIETAKRIVLEAAATTVEQLDNEGLRAEAGALLQDIIGARRAN